MKPSDLIRCIEGQRKVERRDKPPERSSVQPNAGWGDLCVACLNVFRDSAKYGADFKPDFPCTVVRWRGPEAIVPDLLRYVDGTESCSHYAKQEDRNENDIEI